MLPCNTQARARTVRVLVVNVVDVRAGREECTNDDEYRNKSEVAEHAICATAFLVLVVPILVADCLAALILEGAELVRVLRDQRFL